VRKVIQWTLVPAALIVAACSKGKAPTSTAMTEDLKRDLKLASATQNIQISPDEISPKSKQELALRPKKAPEGPKVIRPEHSTVKSTAPTTTVAEIPTDVPQVQVMASAAAPSETPSDDTPPLARPSATPATGYPGASPIPSRGSGGILGGIFGAVIRGGVVDDDHCDPRGGPRRGGGRSIGGDNLPIFGGGIGSMGGTRMPVAPMGRRR